jgi:hypothetical protein
MLCNNMSQCVTLCNNMSQCVTLFMTVKEFVDLIQNHDDLHKLQVQFIHQISFIYFNGCSYCK